MLRVRGLVENDVRSLSSLRERRRRTDDLTGLAKPDGNSTVKP